jgi:biotin carboxyl carrier protein
MNKYQYKVQGVDYDVEIEEVEGNLAKVLVNGVAFEVELQQPINPAHAIVKPKVVAPQPATPRPTTTTVQPQPAATAGTGTPTKSPLPGTITSVNVKVGDNVKEGDTILVLEAMKMQNNIEAECSGTITSILVNPGDTVMEGSILVTIG